MWCWCWCGRHEVLSALDDVALAGDLRLIGSAKRGLFCLTFDFDPDLEDFDPLYFEWTLFLCDDRCDFWLRGGGEGEIAELFRVIFSGCVVGTDCCFSTDTVPTVPIFHQNPK